MIVQPIGKEFLEFIIIIFFEVMYLLWLNSFEQIFKQTFLVHISYMYIYGYFQETTNNKTITDK